MLQIQENVSLKTLNTFRVEAKARWFVEISSEVELVELFSDAQWHSIPRLVLGGGSNVLFTQDYEGLVIKINLKGLRAEVNRGDVLVTAGAGEVWSQFVRYCVDQRYAGIENLSLIPGSVGASPVQNIGAYGVEIKDVFYSCRFFDISEGTFNIFYKGDCGFAYRDSIFKRELKGKGIITEVTFKLSTVAALNTSYGAINQELLRRGIEQPDIKDVSDVVSAIRVEKLPDPATIGNAGSFFKNPVISDQQFEQLQSAFPDIIHFCLPYSTVKLAAGWLIEQCGWKGKKNNEAGTWKNQALVLVNYGNATGSEIYEFSAEIINDVKRRFGITLEREVNVI